MTHRTKSIGAHRHALSPSPLFPLQKTLQAHILKYLICYSKTDIWEMHDWIHLKHKFHFGTALGLTVPFGEGRASKWRWKVWTECWDTQNTAKWAAVLSTAPLAFELSSKLSSVVICLWDVNLYFSSSAQLLSSSSWWSRGWANFSCEEPARKHFWLWGPCGL